MEPNKRRNNIPKMEVVAEPVDIKLNRSSTQVTFNTGFKESNEGPSDEDTNTDKRIEDNQKRHSNSGIEVIETPADIKLNRSSTKVTFNTDFKEFNDGSDEDTNAEIGIEKKRKRQSIPDIEVIAEPSHIRLNRSSTQVTFNTDYKDTQAEVPYDKDSFPEELLEPEDEEPLNTPPESDTSDSNLSYGDDFHPSSDSDSYSDSNSGPERYPMIKENLDNGIFVQLPENHRFEVPYICRPLQLHTRNTQLANLNKKLVGSKLITDMFGVYLKSAKYEEDNLVSLPFSDDCAGEIRISVAVKTKRSPHVKYCAHLRRNGEWKKVPVQMKGDVAECEGCAFDILFLTSEPIFEMIILGPEGKDFISEQDNKIKLSFPRNCVTKTETLHVQIIPTIDDGPIYMDNQPCIIGATKSVHVHHREGIFKLPIELYLELRLFDNSTDPDLTKYNFVDVHAVNKQEREITMRKLPSQSYTQNGSNFSLCMKVDDFSSHSGHLAEYSKINTETGKLLARMAHGEIFHCHILIFMSENKQNYQGKSIRVDCVENKDVQNTIDKLQGKNYGLMELTRCRSPPLFISDGERIRISLRGGIKLPWDFKKDQMILSFLREGLHKHIVFPVEAHFGNRPTNMGYLDFNRVEGRKEVLYQTFFDVDFPLRTTGLGSGFEAASLMSLNLELSSPKFSRASSLTPMESGFCSPIQVSSPECHSTRMANIMLKINTSLSELLITTNWKFTLRAILYDGGVEVDSIISEAEKNNSGNVREAIYSALTTWNLKTNLTTSKQMFDAIIQGLKKENYEQIAKTLKERHEHDVLP